ncbi:MAG: hypothetical protein LWX56_14145 [Ignavibacteria bacterium]|nr:hypothetical protein [Ignavibacteria bacterium]
METVKEFLVIFLLGSASALCLALIYYVSRITKSIEAIQSNIDSISRQFNPLLESLTVLSKSVKILSEDVRAQVTKVGWIVEEMKEKIENVLSIEKRVREAFESPAQSLTSLLSFLRGKVGSLFRKNER